MGAIRGFLSTPARQALAWTAVGLAGFAFAGGGIALMFDGGDGGEHQASAAAAATSTRTATPTPGRTSTTVPSLTPALDAQAASPTAVPSPTSATLSQAQPTPTTAAPEAATTPESTASAEPTSPPLVAGGPYCPSVSQSSPPNSIFGTLTIGGVDAPAGTVVTILFDGIAGASAATTEPGGYKVNWAAGGSECANRVGAAISVSVNGHVIASGATVGGGGGTPVIRLDIALP